MRRYQEAPQLTLTSISGGPSSLLGAPLVGVNVDSVQRRTLFCLSVCWWNDSDDAVRG